MVSGRLYTVNLYYLRVLQSTKLLYVLYYFNQNYTIAVHYYVRVTNNLKIQITSKGDHKSDVPTARIRSPLCLHHPINDPPRHTDGPQSHA